MASCTSPASLGQNLAHFAGHVLQANSSLRPTRRSSRGAKQNFRALGSGRQAPLRIGEAGRIDRGFYVFGAGRSTEKCRRVRRYWRDFDPRARRLFREGTHSPPIRVIEGLRGEGSGQLDLLIVQASSTGGIGCKPYWMREIDRAIYGPPELLPGQSRAGSCGSVVTPFGEAAMTLGAAPEGGAANGGLARGQPARTAAVIPVSAPKRPRCPSRVQAFATWAHPAQATRLGCR